MPKGKDINKVTIKTSKGLRDTLFASLDDLREDKITSQKAKAIAQLSGKLLDTVKLEFVAARFVNIARQNSKDGKMVAQLPAIEL